MKAKKKSRFSRKKRDKSSGKKTTSKIGAGRNSSRGRPAPTTVPKLMLKDSADSGLTPADVKKLARRPSTKADLRKTNFPVGFGMPDAYQIPYFDIDGKQLRYERTKIIGGKYRQPTGSRPHLYFSPLLRKKWRKVLKK